jgi:hypothetical protein
MRLDDLVRLIESANFMSFRELAIKYLKIRGYKEVSLTDGWRNGGIDIKVVQIPPNPIPIAFQVTVDRKWQQKLRADAKKVKENLKLDHLILVTSYRLAEAEFQLEAEAIWAELGVTVRKIDNQAIASTFLSAGKTTEVLETLGISIPQSTQATRDFKLDIVASFVASFVFFGEQTHRFRKSIVESALVAMMAKYYREGVKRPRLESEVNELLQFPDSKKQFVVGAVDRMLQQQKLFVQEQQLFLEPKLLDAEVAMQRLRDKEWEVLKKQIEQAVNNKLPRHNIDSTSLDSLMDSLGALILETARETSFSFSKRTSEDQIKNSLQERLYHLHATLDLIGFPEGANRNQALEELAALASNSRMGKQIMAGELFLSLSSFETPSLIRALGGHSGIEVLLDASVAIPILCGLLYEPASHRFGLATSHLYHQLCSHRISVLLPLDYLEEVATHLIQAWDYRHIVTEDQDLVASENAFVAHYTSLYVDHKIGSFTDYLEGFGLDKTLRGAIFEVARDKLKLQLQRYFDDLYGIKTKLLGNPSRSAQKRADEVIGFWLNSKSPRRSHIVIQHDKRTVAYLFDQDKTFKTANVLCTWDNLHFQVRQNENVSWEVLNPVVLGDILSLALAEQERDSTQIISVVMLAKSLSEETASIGASIWDTLIKIEQENLYDAELLKQAKAFKREFIESQHQKYEYEEIAQAWEKWKEKVQHND